MNSTIEITIQRKHGAYWPVVVRYQAEPTALTLWESGVFDLDLTQFDLLLPSEKEYGTLLGKSLFHTEVRDIFSRAFSEAKQGAEPLRVLLIVEADELRPLHWEQLCAPFEGGRWDYLLLNQQTPFSLYLPSQIERRFPPIGRRDLRALLLVAGPEELDGDYGLDAFDVPATVASIRTALGEIPCDTLVSQMEGAVGEPTLDTLCETLSHERYTFLHIVCHGAYKKDSGETVLYFPQGERLRPVAGSQLIERLSRLDQAHGLPHFTFLSTCESANPQAETGLGSLGQRLVRELGMPAVLAMTDQVSIRTAQALAVAFYTRLKEHGEVDCALAQALVGLQGRYDVTVPALISRLGGHPLFSDALDRPLTKSEIRFGLDQAKLLFEQRAPVLLAEFEEHAATTEMTLGTQAEALSPSARHERETALEAVNQLCSQALDLTFNALALGQKPPDYDPRTPFRGLYPFRAEDCEFFFGREALVDKLAGRLNRHRFLAILGPSGCGKSSLLLAGLVPKLGLPMAYLTPGSKPLAQLDTALATGSRGNENPKLIVVDQFEELFTLCKNEDQRQAFIECLLTLPQEAYLVLTMRADFWGECAAYPALKEEMQAHQELVAPLDAGELRRAMERQADHVRLRFEDGLGDKILEDVQGEPGAMPLLQHALLLLWNRRHGRWLRWEEYRAFGGIKQAIAHTADELYKGLDSVDQARVRDIFVRLTHLDDTETEGEVRDTRRRVGLAELVPAGSDPSDTVSMVKRLADARLVVTGVNPASEQEEVEVAHEALIRHWPRLRDWLDEDRIELRLRDGIREAALEWEAGQRADHLLVHRGGRLEDAEALSRQPKFTLNELEQAYLRDCVELRERERREKEAQQQRELEAAHKLANEQKARADEQAAATAKMRRRALIITAVGAVAILMAVFAGFFFLQAQGNEKKASNNAATAQANSDAAVAARATAEAERDRADRQARLALSRLLATQAQRELAANNQVLGLLLGVEAVKTAEIGEAFQVLQDGLSKIGRPKKSFSGHQERITYVSWNEDGSQILSGGWDDSVRIWDAKTGAELANISTGFLGWVNQARWNVAGTKILVATTLHTASIYDAKTGDLLLELKGHIGEVESAIWNKDETRILTTAGFPDDFTARIWDAETGAQIHVLKGHTSRVSQADWSPDEGRVLTASEDGTARLWDANTGDEILKLQTSGISAYVNQAVWSSDGNRILTAHSDNNVYIWDARNGQTLLNFKGTQAAWSPDESRLLTGGNNGISIYNTSNGAEIMHAQGHSGLVNLVAWSPDETQVVSADSSGDVKIWDAQTGELLLTLAGNALCGHCVAWSPDGTQIVTANSDHHLRVWGTKSGREALVLPGDWGHWFDNERYLFTVTSDRKVHIWQADSGDERLILIGPQEEAAYASWMDDGTRLMIGGCEMKDATGYCIKGTVHAWDAIQGTELFKLDGNMKEVGQVAWNEDYSRIFTTGCEERNDQSWCTGSTLRVWDGINGAELYTLSGHTHFIDDASWDQSGRYILTASRDGTVRKWDAEKGKQLYVVQAHSEGANQALWNTDETQFLTSGCDHEDSDGFCDQGSAKVWGTETGEEIFTLASHTDEVYEAVWSPDEGLILTRSYDTLQIWNAQTGSLEATVQPHTESFWSVAWSEDGSSILTSGCELYGTSGCAQGSARLWNVSEVLSKSDQDQILPVLELAGHQGYVYLDEAPWSPDGTMILTYSTDGTARVWNADNGDILLILSGHGEGINRAFWDNESSSVLTWGDDNTVRIWPVNPKAIIDQVCMVVSRNMTQEEWARYMKGQDYQASCPNKPVEP